MKILIIYLSMIFPCFAFQVPLGLKNWESVSYDGIKPNSYSQSSDGLKIKVDKSSSPLVLKLNAPKQVSAIKIRAKLEGSINYQASPGSKSSDDFPLRLGLITKGKNNLNFFQRSFAPNWVIKLSKLGEEYGGFGRIQTYLFYLTPPDFSEREHPLSEYFYEIKAEPFKSNELDAKIALDAPLEVIGIWLSSDGDDTKSSFTVSLLELRLN